MRNVAPAASGSIIAYHGTDRTAFDRFDVSAAGPYNVGLHFGTRAAALSRLDYLQSATPRLLKCRLDIRNSYRIADVFGHSYAQILDTLQAEIGRACHSVTAALPLRSEIAALIDEYMMVDDDPVLSRRGEEYLAYCHRLNADIIRLFQSLGYDSLVYTNELEDGESAADSYVVFDASQVTVLEESPVTISHAQRAA